MEKSIAYLVQQYNKALDALDLIQTIYAMPWPGDPLWNDYKETLISTLAEFDLTYDDYDRVLMHIVLG